MAAPARLDYTNAHLPSITVDAYSRDLRDVPISTMVQHGECVDIYHYFNFRDEAAPANGLVAEGASFSDPSAADYTRPSNTTQIIRQSFAETRTMSAIASIHGRDQYLVEMDQAEVNWAKSMEFGMIRNTQVTTGTRQQAGLRDTTTWGSGSTIPANLQLNEIPLGAGLGITKAMVLLGQQACDDDGKAATFLVVEANRMQEIAGFSTPTRVTNRDEDDNVLVDYIDVYHSGFGPLGVVKSRNMPDTDALGFDPEYVIVRWLRHLELLEGGTTESHFSSRFGAYESEETIEWCCPWSAFLITGL